MFPSYTFPTWVRNAFSFYGKCLPWVIPLEQSLANWPMNTTNLFFFFIVLIEHGPAHIFAHCLWMLLRYNGRVKQFQQRSAKPKRLTIWPLADKAC